MKKVNILLLLLITIAFTACQTETTTDHSTEAKRIVSLSGFLTEVLFDLGYGDQIVGVDITSVYPSETDSIPKLGHVSQLNAEAILALKPNFIFVEKAQFNQTEVLSQLEKAGIQIIPITTSKDLNNAVNAANQLKNNLEITDKAIQKIAKKIETDSLKLVEMVSKSTKRPKVLFIYARGAGRLMVGGTKTSAEAMILKSGGQNAMTSFENFKPLTPEALIETAPDVILMFSSGLASLDGKAGLAQIKGIPQTPAYQNNKIIAMDGHYLTAFGSRAGEAAIELAEQLQE
jgi:iron complex transport system substrate-binding protein